MNYHVIKHDDMNNGTGIRVTLFVSGCKHNCPGCHNPQTHDPKSGKLFDDNALNEIKEQLDKDYISGLTISGGDPLLDANVMAVYQLVYLIRGIYPNKTIWIYTGYTWEDIIKDKAKYAIIKLCDIVVEGPFIKELADKKYKWAGSTNQKVINIKDTVASNNIVLL